MTDLDAIRERDAEIWAERDVPRDISVLDAMDAERDRRTLLAEVDRLTAENERLTYYEFAWRDDFAVVEHAERARIRAAVEGLPPHPFARTVPGAVDHAAVLDLIDRAMEGER